MSSRGPHLTNQLIHEALHRYADDLVIVTKVGARRGTDGSVLASDVSQRLRATPAQIAIAWLLRRAPNILLIAGTSSVAHLRENVPAAILRLSDEAFVAVNELTRLRA